MYELAPLAFNTDEPPLQILALLGVTVNVKLGSIVIVAVAEPVQVPEAPKTVYVVAVIGLAVTLTPTDELNVAAGDQV